MKNIFSLRTVLAVLLAFTAAISFSQNSVGEVSTRDSARSFESPVEPPAPSRTSGTATTDNITLQTPLNEITFSNIDDSNDATASQISGGTGLSTFWLFVRMIFVLAVIIGIVYAVIYFLKRTNRLPSDDEVFLRKVSQVTLAPGKTAQVITLLDHAYIVGVSDDSVNLIAEVKDEELIQSMNTYADRTNRRNQPKTFQEILEIFSNGKKSAKGNGGVFSEETESMRESFERQREILTSSSADESNEGE